MDDICRLCCSKNFVNNNIFDEENALYLKMSLYLPIKVFKNDRLPQKVCDKCSCKVNDFYQFCNETIEVQNRLRSYLLSSGICSDDIVDLTLIKESASPLPGRHIQEQGTQTDHDAAHIDSYTGPILNVQVKQEPRMLSPVKEENTYDDYKDGFSDNSDDISLITLKKKKRNKKSEINGVEKKARKKKPKLNDLHMLMNSLPNGTNVSMVDTKNIAPVKEELPELNAPMPTQNFDVTLDVKQVKNELLEMEAFNCCICMMQCYNKNEMIQHYRAHANESSLPTEPPAAPPPPDQEPLRCVRCRKVLTAAEWAPHWQRHWERDRRPYHCALCEKTFRDPHQILKHGLTHKHGEGAGAGAAGAEALDKRFICDLCPESFVYMRSGGRAQVPAGAPRARAPRGARARAGAALRRVRALVRAPQLAAAAPARALGPARPPVQRVRQGALQPRAPQVPHPHPHRLQAQRLQDVRQGLREEVQPDAARARALRREAARVLALREGVQSALHVGHTREVPQRRAALRVRAVRPRVRRQGAALHAPQEHVHLAAGYL